MAERSGWDDILGMGMWLEGLFGIFWEFFSGMLR